MNKILILYINDFPYFYQVANELSLEYLGNYIGKSCKDFDLIETILDLETYKKLYYANIYNNSRG